MAAQHGSTRGSRAYHEDFRATFFLLVGEDAGRVVRLVPFHLPLAGRGYFTQVFVVRGFGVAVGTHSAYDILVGWLGWHL
jgi:hypothetical protein